MRRSTTASRFCRQSVDAAGRGGVADQDNTCRNGTRGCPGPESAASTLPCSACFLGAEGESA
jgi:hypothetical protein